MTLTVAGLAAFGRSSAVLVQDGAMRAGSAEETLSRRKNDAALPVNAFRRVCERAGVAKGDVDFVAFAEKPLQRFVRILGRLAQGFPFTWRSFPRTLTTWLGDRLWLEGKLVESLGLPRGRFLYVERPVAQAAAAFFTSGFDEAAVLVVDDVHEWSATTLLSGKANALVPLEEIQHPHSLAAFLDAIGHHLLVPETGGLRWQAPLAARGEPRLAAAMEALVRPERDGAYALDAGSFDFSRGTPRFTARARALLGAPRGPADDPLRWADVARSAQAVAEERILALCEHARRSTQSTRLCLSGSVFQHPAILEWVMREAPFAEVHADPYLDEASAALGAALYVTHAVHGLPHARLDARIREAALPPAPAGSGWSAHARPREELAAHAVEALRAGRVVALCAGEPELEASPRGARVLLADPGRKDALATLRSRIKRSESYVPVALCGLEPAVAAWLEPRTRAAAERAQVPVRVPRPLVEALDAGVLVGGTALVHAVDEGTQPLLASILREFEARERRAPLLAQSSLNRAGDPPVGSAPEAIDLLRGSEIELLLWGEQEVRR